MVTLVTITGIAILQEPTAAKPNDGSVQIPSRVRELARLNPELLPLVLALIQKASLSDSVHPLTSHDIEKVLAENAPNITLDSEEVDELAKGVLLHKMQNEEGTEQLENDTQARAPEIFASKSNEVGKIDLTFILHNRLSPEISIKTLEKKIEQLIQESLKGEKQSLSKDLDTQPKVVENLVVKREALPQTNYSKEKITFEPHSQEKAPAVQKEPVVEKEKPAFLTDRYAIEIKEAQSIKVHPQQIIPLPTQHVIVNITSPYAVHEDRGKKKKTKPKKRKKSAKQKKRQLGKLLKKIFEKEV